MTKPMRDWDRFIVRLPDGMKHDLEDMAAENCRPVNGQIIYLLRRGIAAEKSTTGPQA